MRSRIMPVALASVLGSAASACVAPVVSPRSLHVVHGEDVYSRAPSSAAYAAYARARLAYERGEWTEAMAGIERAIRLDPRDPHLWTARAEFAAAVGDSTKAMAALDRALRLRPDYPPAVELAARLESGATRSVAESPRRTLEPSGL